LVASSRPPPSPTATRTRRPRSVIPTPVIAAACDRPPSATGVAATTFPVSASTRVSTPPAESTYTTSPVAEETREPATATGRRGTGRGRRPTRPGGGAVFGVALPTTPIAFLA